MSPLLLVIGHLFMVLLKEMYLKPFRKLPLPDGGVQCGRPNVHLITSWSREGGTVKTEILFVIYLNGMS
jgi:hypothetical protein